ncbi:MAG: TolC family protein [Planctomycetota bacterium]
MTARLPALLLCPLLLSAAESEVPPTATPTTTAAVSELTTAAIASLGREQADAVRAARSGHALALTQARAVKAVLFPNLSATGEYRYLDDDSVIGGFTAPSHDSYRASLRAEQLLWSFGRIGAALDAERAQIERADASLVETMAMSERRARDLLARYRLALADRDVAQAQVEQRQGELTDAEARAAAGDVSQLDVREARLNLIQAENALRATSSRSVTAKEALATVLALPAADFTTDSALTRPQDLGDLFDAAQAAIDHGAALRSLAAEATLSAANHAEQRSRMLPEFYGFGEWASIGPDIDDQNDTVAVGVNLRWSFYDGGASLARMHGAEHERIRLLRLREGERRRRHERLTNLATELANLDANINAEQQAVTLAEHNYADARAQYRAGMITRTRMNDSNLLVTQIRLRVARLIHQEIIAANELRYLSE